MNETNPPQSDPIIASHRDMVLQLNSGRHHPDRVNAAYLQKAVEMFVNGARMLDHIKRCVYSDKAKQPQPFEHYSFGYDQDAVDHNLRIIHPDLLHAVLGMSTEAGELVEAIAAFLEDGIDIDLTNIDEEVGDSDWYKHLYAIFREKDLREFLVQNESKLRTRYPNGWSQDDLDNRNLEAERAALEGGGA